MFINAIFSVCNNVNMHPHPDDIQIYASRRIGLAEDLCCILKEDLADINKWAVNKDLHVIPISRVKIDHNYLLGMLSCNF